MPDCLRWRQEREKGHCDCYRDGKPCCHCSAEPPAPDPRTDPSEGPSGGQSTAGLTVAVVGDFTEDLYDELAKSLVKGQAFVLLSGSREAVVEAAQHLFTKVRVVPVEPKRG